MAARCCAGEHQVGEVYAGHYQNQSDDACENVERPCKLGTQISAHALCRR